MKVVYVFRSLAMWGGIERILVDKMNCLVEMYGAEVCLLTADQGSHAIPYTLARGVHVEDLGIRFHQQYQYGGFRRLWKGRQLRRLFERRLSARLAEIQPDVIVAVATAYADSVAKVKRRVPMIVESHSICLRTLHSDRFLHQYYDFRLKHALRRAQCIVALTEGDAREWRRIYGEQRVRVIPNMVHLNTTGRQSTLQQRRVIFAGRLDYQKRAMSLLHIWQRVYPQHPDWALDIYGEGEEQQAVEQRARQLGMNIRVNQPTGHIFDRYCDSSILVSTSLFEPFGLVIPEAMSCGLPVVAYDCPYGPSALITDGEDGFLVPMDDEQAFAARLDELMGSEPLRRRMGQAAILKSHRFAPPHVMPAWKELLEEVSGKKFE